MYKLFGHYLPGSLIYLCLIEGLIYLVFVYTGFLLAEARFSAAINTPDTAVLTGIMLISMLAMGLYRRDLREKFQAVLLRLCLSLLLGSCLLYLYFVLKHDVLFTHLHLFLTVGCAFFCIVLCRYLLYRRVGAHVKRVLVLGAGRKARRLQLMRRGIDRVGIKLVGFIDMEDSDNTSVSAQGILKRLNGADFDYAGFISSHGIDEVVIALDEARNRLPTREIMQIKMQGVHVIDINTFLERQLGKIDLNTFKTSSFIFSDGFSTNLLGAASKRFMDVVISGIMLVASVPIMALTALAIWVESGCRGTVIYRQERTGVNNRTFNIIKFRSMQENAEGGAGPVWAASNDARVTRVGRFIRKTRLDELPQLLNVIRGDMSLVGPRPERPQFTRRLDKMLPYYRLRSCVKPGITGWAQICYPYGASVHDAGEKLQFDLYYIKHQNIFLDLLILLQTIAVIFLCKGAR